MSLVLDGSATLGWLYPDERARSRRRLSNSSPQWARGSPRLAFGGANSLQIGIRRGRIDELFRDGALLGLADRFRLTTYDAAYLELAHRRSLPLAALDGPLCAAARILDVPPIGD